jgi:hypothetical protein
MSHWNYCARKQISFEGLNFQSSASDSARQQRGLNGRGFKAKKASAKCEGSCDGGADRRTHSDGFKRESKGHCSR